jgi:hypothetical protein
MSQGTTCNSANKAQREVVPTPGEIRTVLADLLSLAENARDAAGNSFMGDRPHFAIRQAQALLPRIGR